MVPEQTISPEPPEPDQPPRPRRFARWDRLFALVPLLVLALDFVLSPHLVESRYDIPALDLGEVDGFVDLGKVHLHSLRVSLGSVGDGKWNPGVNALVVAVSPGEEGGKVGLGPFASAILDALPPADRGRFLEFLAGPQTPGSAQVFQRERPHEKGALSPIDYIFVLYALPGRNPEALKALSDGLRAVFAQTEGKPVSGLLLPCLTVGPYDPNTPTLDDFFEALFAALQSSGSPRNVDISFYDGWPYEFQEAAAASFNKSWQALSGKQEGFLSRLHRFDLRLLLLSLSICLLASSFHVELTPKNFVILTCSFSLAILGSAKILDWLAGLYGPEKRSAFAVVVAFVEALGFPYFVRWRADDLFKTRET